MNPTVVLTLILLTLMVAAGVASGSIGYSVGREALKGIRQPDVRPVSNTSTQTNPQRREGLTFLREEDILADVKARMSGNVSDSAEDAGAQTKAIAEPAVSPATDATSRALPISSQEQQVVFQVNAVGQQSGALVLDVSLQNNGSRSVQFLYSFLDVMDDRGRIFSASTEGLPSELPPGSNAFSGTVSIPSALLDGSERLTLTLTDYPAQQLKLQLSDIPVVR